MKSDTLRLLAAAVVTFTAVTTVPAQVGHASPAAAATRPAATARSAAGSRTAAAGSPALLHAHAHNDYLNVPPLTGALGHDFTSVEADVWLRDDPDSGEPTLVLCHDYEDASHLCYDDEDPKVPQPQRTLKTTYLDGLRTWIDQHGGSVYPVQTTPVHLLVEIKCDTTQSVAYCTDGGTGKAAGSSPNNPLNVLRELEKELVPYHSMLYSPSNPAGPVQVIVTGGHNENPKNDTYDNPGGTPAQATVKDLLQGESDHWVYLDGDLGADHATPDPLVPLVSFGYQATTTPAEDGLKCALDPAKQLNRPGYATNDQVDQILDAHANGHQVRVWALPDCPSRASGTDTPAYKTARESAWNDAKQTGIDFISSNHLQFLQTWLTDNDNTPPGGGGDCGAIQTIPAGTHHGTLKAQYCTVWTANVPVYATADPGGTVIGHLTDGDRANWFVGQTQGTTVNGQPHQDGRYCYPGQDWCNDWWAYTEADNGQWGWVPVVYFSGGTNDQPATDLAGCHITSATADICHPS